MGGYRGQGNRFPPNNVADDLREVLSSERALTGEAFESNDRQREEIGPRIEFLVQDLLRCHITRSPHHRSSWLGLSRPDRIVNTGDPEIKNEDVVVFINENIRRFDVSVDDRFAVSVIEPCRDLTEVFDGLRRSEFLSLIEKLLKRFALNVIHHDERGVAVSPDLKDSDDILMAEISRGTSLVTKTFERRIRVVKVARHQLS
jgi:hypothetical protein